MFKRLLSLFTRTAPSILTEESAAQYVRDHFAQFGQTAKILDFDHSENGMIQVGFSVVAPEDGARICDGNFAVWVSDDGAPHLYGEW